MRVSVVVATYQRAGRLPGLVAALEAQTLPRGEFEVVISDDGSADETPAVLAGLVARSGLDLRVVRMPRNGGAGAARNLGWRAARAPVVAFTDDDCLPAPGWLEAGLARLDSSGAGIVQGRTLPDPAATLDPEYARSQSLETFTKRYETCNIFYRTDVLRATSGFDESIYFFGEDTDLGWRAKDRGVTTDFAPEALVHHEVTRKTVRYLWRFSMQHRNWATLVRRHPEMRKEILIYRVFIKRVHVGFLAAVAGAIVAPFWLPGLALAVPYVWHRRPRALKEIAAPFWNTLFDGLVLGALVVGSVRERTLVL
ncbi:MAG: glycosyltransferase family 2 protein [Actinomycetota bacterium]